VAFERGGGRGGPFAGKDTRPGGIGNEAVARKPPACGLPWGVPQGYRFCLRRAMMNASRQAYRYSAGEREIKAKKLLRTKT